MKHALALCALAFACACDDPAPVDDEPQCLGAAVCALDMDCSAGSFCDGSCCAVVTACGRRQDCSPPICVDTLPIAADAAFLPVATLCDGGVCIIDDGIGGCFESAPPPASCIVVNGGVAISGRPRRMEALALDERGAPASYPPVTTWSFDGDSLTTTCDGPAACVVDVTAQMGPVSCTGSVRVYPPADVRSSRVIVVDERSHAPIADVRVELVMDGATAERFTDDDGVVSVDGRARIVSVMPDAHEWHTLIDPPADVVIVTRAQRPPRERSGTVNFDRLHTQGDVQLALTGFAVPSLADMRLVDLFGVPVPTNIELEGITDPGGQLVPLPSALVMFLADDAIRPEWTAFGDNQLTWSIGLQVPLAEVGPILSGVAGGGGLSSGVLAGVLPFFARADHFVGIRDDLISPSMLSLASRELVVGARDAPHVLTAAFARVPGRGVVPLGFSADVDDVVTTQFAPPHDGLEGSEVFVAAIALDLDALDTTATQLARSPLGDSVAIAMPAFVPLVDVSFDGETITTLNDPGADLYRVRFDGWTVWSATPLSFTLDELLRANVPPLRSRTASVDAFVTSRAFDVTTLQDLDALATSMSSTPLQ